MSKQASNSFSESIQQYGCSEVVSLEEGLVDPAQLNYIDLLPKGARAKKRPTPVTAIAEHQGVALLYLVDDTDGKLTREKREETQNLLANRSDPAWLGVVKPGSLEIYPIGFKAAGRSLNRIEVVDSAREDAPLFFQSLVQGTFSGSNRAESADYVFRKIFSLLNDTSEAFVPSKLLKPLDVLSMAGRALFFRFLIDRDIVRDKELPEICEGAKDLKDVFSNAEKAARTSRWLDETFNGDFLTLFDEAIPHDDSDNRLKAYRKFYRETGKKTDSLIFVHLAAILNGAKVEGELFQTEFDWGELNFAHIPVGVLSQVYESFSHLDDPDKAARNSVHYTPRIIANLMVDQAFSSSQQPASAKVLDPSCGAGIFLVLSFRRLIMERWMRDGKRPDVRVIQDTLYKHLRGFDVSESALRLAALSLYITAIELNATPYPPKSLRFPKNLRDSVLHQFGPDDDETEDVAFSLGSLQDEVADTFAGQFDIVIGNPPWTRLREKEPENTEEALAGKREKKSVSPSAVMNAEFTRIGREVFKERGLDDLAKRYESPDKNPDLPFIWRSTQWAKEDGIITLALPARIMHRSGKKGGTTWEAIARTLFVTGLINGSNLRKTGVWEGVDFPWCVLFAKNRTSPPEHQFRFSAPVYDLEQNKFARFRIDYEGATVVNVAESIKRPWLLKTLSLGNYRDVDLMDDILKAFPETLDEVWKSWDPKGKKTGEGFNLSPKLTQRDAKFLEKIPVFERPEGIFSISALKFTTFGEKYQTLTACFPRREELYDSPLIVIPQSPGDDHRTAKAFFSRRALAFNKSNYGYSTNGHKEEDALAGLIYLIAHSTLFRYFCLMTSVRVGADRQTFNKNEFDALPFPRVEELPASTRKKVCRIADQLEFDDEKPWDELDTFIFELYQLDETDVQYAKDTLFASASYRHAGRDALRPPTPKTRDQFALRLQDFLQPFFVVCGHRMNVAEPSFQQDVYRGAWFFLTLYDSDDGDHSGDVPSELLVTAMAQANENGSSRVIVRIPGRNGLLLGLLSQQRWWTQSRAVMCGQQILREHLDAFQIEAKEVID
ncbi:MAG: N-6 DNA methylase [Verrucomicrobiales bacterium]|nr:N-6 DNA methylase [Verrucomicrobiales bacterium]